MKQYDNNSNNLTIAGAAVRATNITLTTLLLPKIFVQLVSFSGVIQVPQNEFMEPEILQPSIPSWHTTNQQCQNTDGKRNKNVRNE